MRTLIILLLCTNTSFAIAQISPKAVEKNNQSVKTAGFFNDSDSLNKAIHLSDEAIALEPSYKLAYANKIKYLMALGQKEKALQTMLQMEKFSPDDPYYILGKGMMLEENAKKSLAMDAYKQAASLFEKRLKEKPTEANLTGIQSKSDTDPTANDGVPNGAALKNDVTVQTTAASATVDNTIVTMTKRDESNNAYVNMEITNQKQFMLPMTGGAGSYLLIIAGVVAAGCGMMILRRNKRQPEK